MCTWISLGYGRVDSWEPAEIEEITRSSAGGSTQRGLACLAPWPFQPGPETPHLACEGDAPMRDFRRVRRRSRMGVHVGAQVPCADRRHRPDSSPTNPTFPSQSEGKHHGYSPSLGTDT